MTPQVEADAADDVQLAEQLGSLAEVEEQEKHFDRAVPLRRRRLIEAARPCAGHATAFCNPAAQSRAGSGAS